MPPVNYLAAHRALHSLADPEQAKFLSRFFKTGKGQYGEGDRFLGIKVPVVRTLVKPFSSLSLSDLDQLIRSPYNEERLLALFILDHQFSRSDSKERAKLIRFYLEHLQWVNNWNLVDASAPDLLGVYLLDRSRAPLYRLARSKNLWQRRVAIVSTYSLIRADDFKDTLKLAVLFLDDDQDLMHKACGWMLREVGKRDTLVLEKFLNQYHQKMPRTMLRYAIERFPEKKRLSYLKGKIETSVI